MAANRHIKVSDWANIAKAEDKFRYNVIKDARRGLMVKKRRRVASGRYVNSAINTTGNLSSSLRSSRKNLVVTLDMDYYGQFVDAGRRAGKGVPRGVLDKWIRKKGIKIRDYKTGMFLPKTDKNVATLAYLFNRTIKRYGILATDFWSDPFEYHYMKLLEDLGDAIFADLDVILPNE